MNRQQAVILERDETCDESAGSFIRGRMWHRKKSPARGQPEYQNLIRVQGMENIRLPGRGTLRCYNFEWDGIEK